MNTNQVYLQNLTGLRFFGAMMIFLYHFFSLQSQTWTDLNQHEWFHYLSVFASRGHFSINLFFVLSGFLITYLLLNETLKTGTISILRFLIRRILRVWPLYFVFILFGFFIFPLLPYGGVTEHSFWMYAFFLPNFDEIAVGLKDSYNFLTITWSIGIEEQFYLIYGLIFGGFVKTKFNLLPYFLVLTVIASLIFRYIHLQEPRLLYYHSLSIMQDISIGALLGYFCLSSKLTTFFSRLKKGHIIIVYGIGICFLLFEERLLGGNLFLLHRLIPDLFFAFVIGEQVYAKHSFWQADRFKTIRFGGKITYGFYIWHTLVFYYVFQQYAEKTASAFDFFLLLICCFILTCFVSLLSYYMLEKPFLKLKRFYR